MPAVEQRKPAFSITNRAEFRFLFSFQALALSHCLSRAIVRHTKLLMTRCNISNLPALNLKKRRPEQGQPAMPRLPSGPPGVPRVNSNADPKGHRDENSGVFACALCIYVFGTLRLFSATAA